MGVADIVKVKVLKYKCCARQYSDSQDGTKCQLITCIQIL